MSAAPHLAVADTDIHNRSLLLLRLLMPFSFDGEGREQIRAALANEKLGPHALWSKPTVDQIPHLYRNELLHKTVSALFGDGPTTESTHSSYWRMQPAQANRLLRKLLLTTSRGRYSLRQHPLAGVELFLSHFGVGVISITLEVDRELSPPELSDVTYHLSQTRPYSACTLRVPHPAAEPERLSVLSEAERQSIKPPPDQEAPLEERLGHAGAQFTLAELLHRLLLPIQQAQPLQDQFSVYSVSRFREAGAGIGNREFLDKLIGLSQLEETSHPGTQAELSDIPTVVLNSHHVAAVSLLGSAHFVADQTEPSHGFNDERVPRCALKYFQPYLLCMLQRAILMKLEHRAAELSNGRAPATELSRLRTDLLEYGLRFELLQVSTRSAVNRYYRVCREALQLPNMYEHLRKTLSDVESREHLQAQVSHLSALRESSEHMSKLQEKVEHLEVLVLAAYGIEASHLLFGAAAEWLPVLKEKHWLEFVVIACGGALGWLSGKYITKWRGSGNDRAGHEG